MIKMISMDLDNTLLNAQKTISHFTAQVLLACQRKGILLAFVTARPVRAATARQAAVVPDIVIANNGATLCLEGEIMDNHCIPADMLRRLLADLLKEKAVTSITAEAGDCLYTTYDGPPWEEGWAPVHTDFQHFPYDRPIPKISVECEQAEAVRRLMVRYPGLHAYANAGEHWCQMMCKEVTKANALRQVTERLGISLAEVVAFGDDINDMDMLMLCGKGIAVENAVDILKERADAVCGANTADGVAKWLAAHVLEGEDAVPKDCE